MRLVCGSCGQEMVLGFLCKPMDFCPSCLGRRMNDTAAHLVDRVLPFAPFRQWVLSMHGKLLFVDAAASWKDLSRDGRDYGHDYRRLLAHADHLVVWNYFSQEKLPPEASRELAQPLAGMLPTESWTMSLGLWGLGNKPISPEELGRAVTASLSGGARRIWITPSDPITSAHWNAILKSWLVPVRGPRPTRAPDRAGPPEVGEKR